MNLEKLKELVDGRMAELQRLTRIGKRAKEGKKISAGDEAWAADLAAEGAGVDGLVNGPTSRKILRLVLGVSERTFTTLLKEGMPRAEWNQFNLPQCVAWNLARELAKERRRILGEKGTPKEAKSKLRDDLRRERIREAKRRNDLAEGRLVNVEELKAWTMEIAQNLRSEFEAVARAHGPEVERDIFEAVDRFDSARAEKFGGKHGS
jgi:hypothetical protein